MPYRSKQRKHGGGKFKSERQRRYMWAVVPGAAKKWAHNKSTRKTDWVKRRPAIQASKTGDTVQWTIILPDIAASTPQAVDGARLVTMPGIPIADSGVWECLTGEIEFTDEMLDEWIEAAADPGIGLPRLKRGHLDPRFKDDALKDGEPLIGLASNLRRSEDGKLVADFAGLDPDFAEALPYRYPARSIEAKRNVTSPVTGKTYKTALHAVALIPDEGAVATLPDLPLPDNMQECETIAASKRGFAFDIAASWTPEDVRRSWDAQNRREADNSPDMMWEWIEQIEIDPNTIIVNAGEKYYRVPFLVSTNGEVSFDNEARIEVERAYVPKGKTATDEAVQIAASWRVRSESRPVPTNKKENSMDPKMLRASLGLAEDATDEMVASKLNEAGFGLTPVNDDGGEGENEGENNENEAGDNNAGSSENTVNVPEGMSLIDTATLETLQEGVAVAASLKKERDDAARDAAIEEAIMAGKFPRHRADHYKSLWDADPEGTPTILASLAAGTVPVDGERGVAAGVDASDNADHANIMASFGVATRKDG